MSSVLARRPSLPQLPPRWTAPDSAASQSDRAEGARAARDGADAAGALERFWRRLATEGAGDLVRLYGECARLLADHDAKRDRLRHEHDVDLVGQAAANDRRHDERVGALKRELGPEAPAYKERAAEAEDAQRALRAVRGEVNSRPLRAGAGPLYPLLMLALALAEVPVNRAAFELTFREEPLFSLLLAAAVGVILVSFAHVVGLVLRQWPRRPSLGGIAARVAALAVILGTAGAGVYVMAKMRQGFMRLVSAESDGFAQRLQEALRGGTQQAAAMMADVPLSIGDWTFIAVNVLIFTFGVVASFLRHDPHPDYEKAIREARKTERAFAKAEARHGAKLREETARYEERKRSVEGQMGELRATMAALAGQSGGIDEHCASSRLLVAQAIRRRCGDFVDGFGAAAAGDRDPVGRAPPAAPAIEAVLAELPSHKAAAHAG